MREAQQFSQLTPYEINILFTLIKSFRDDEYKFAKFDFKKNNFNQFIFLLEN